MKGRGEEGRKIERDVESVVNRTHDDLTKMVMDMKLDSGSWKKSLRKIGVIQ